MRASGKTSELYEQAQQVIAGGVSSDARRVDGVPLFVDRAQGAYLWDVDGNRYVDYVLGQGPALLGHCPPAVVAAIVEQASRGLVYSAQHQAEVDVARAICELVPGVDRVRFNSVGSEAVHAALRLARGFTGRSKVIKFEGHYHGWLDPVLYSVHPSGTDYGPPDRPNVVAGTRGQQVSSAADVVVVPWNNEAAVAEAFARYPGEIAAVITEPVLCNSGAIEPEPGYLAALRTLAHDHGALLIFDEIITGFRIAPGGAGEFYGVVPDLVTFGKAVAGGMQLSVLAGRAEVMDLISRGEVAHAGTFNSHPVAIAAARAVLEVIGTGAEQLYPELFRRGRLLMAGLQDAAAEVGEPVLVAGPGPMFQVYFTDGTQVGDYRDFAATDRAKNRALQQRLAERGINVTTRGLWFLSTAHTDADVEATVAAFSSALRELQRTNAEIVQS